VEFALIFSFVFVPLTFGLIDYGFMINRDTMINNAAREGAREGSIDPTGTEACDATSPSQVMLSIKCRVLQDLPSLNQNDVTVSVTCRQPDGTACSGTYPAGAASGGTVVVTVDYNYHWVTLSGTSSAASSPCRRSLR